MTTISRFQLNAIVRAGLISASVYWPTTDLGQNVPGDSSYTTMRIFNDRMTAGSFFTTDIGAALPSTSQDANGIPTAAFGIKLAQGGAANQFASDPSTTGTWYMEYTASVQRGITVPYQGSLTSHTFSGGVGKVQLSYTAGLGQTFAVVFDGPVTSLPKIFDPTTSATAIASGAAAVPRWNTQYLRTFQPYAYGRMMDNSGVNGDYLSGSGSSLAFQMSVAWSDRPTPTNVGKFLSGTGLFWPLEWQIDLLNTAGKNGWFNISEFATDDCITQFGTLVAQTLNAGKWAAFELSNERWQSSGGNYTYAKAGVAGLAECQGAMASTSGNRFSGLQGQGANTFSSDGTTATVVFAQPHGATTGTAVKVFQAQTGYTGFAPASATITVVDSVTITYPCTQASTGGTVTGAVVMGNIGFIALNANTQLIQTGLIGSVTDLSYYWHARRTWQMAGLLKAAFAAVGRPASDCKPLFADQAGVNYRFGTKHLVSLLASISPGSKLSDRLAAYSIGGYFGVDQTIVKGNVTGMTKGPLDASLTTEAAIDAQLASVINYAYAAYCYQTIAAFCRDQGLELWGYEIGLDLTPDVGGAGSAIQTAKDAYQVDYATYGASIESYVKNWMRNLQALGFSKIGWYQCGAGTQSGFGGFSLGQTANEIDYTTASSGQSPKFRGLIDSTSPPGTAYTSHAFPCTLSGYDCVGNEAVATTGGVWPALSGTNVPGSQNGYMGANNDALTYRVWSETAQTVTVTIVGDYTSGGATTIVITPLGGTSVNMSVSAAPITAALLGTCSIPLQSGNNYVMVSGGVKAAFLFPHSVQFS